MSRSVLSVHDKIEATTFIIQNFTEHVWFCTSALQTASRYWEARVDQYNGSIGNFFLSMLQHVLAQVISIFNISTSIEENVAANN